MEFWTHEGVAIAIAVVAVSVVLVFIKRRQPSLFEAIKLTAWLIGSALAFAGGFMQMLMSVGGGTMAQTLFGAFVVIASLISLVRFTRAVDERNCEKYKVDPYVPPAILRGRLQIRDDPTFLREEGERRSSPFKING